MPLGTPAGRDSSGRPLPAADRRACPDEGVCHHDCTLGCFRVQFAGPLSGVFPGNQWPAEVIAAERDNDGRL